ncbi:MAG: transposase [Rhodobacter sp.]|nr:transposase [Rhodobacter sp.]
MADISAAPPLLAAMPAPARLIADRGCDAKYLRGALAARGVEAVIPSTRSRKCAIPHDAVAYRERNKIEHAFCAIKDGRRIATRQDKLAWNFVSATAIAAAIIWWT